MIRKSGNRFSEKIMLRQKDAIMIRFNPADHDGMIGEGQGTV